MQTPLENKTNIISIDSPLLDEKGAAWYLQVSVGTLRNWRGRNSKAQGPRLTRFGKSVRYHRADLDAFIERCAEQAASATDESPRVLEAAA